MAIITQPLRPVISCYRPIQFEVLTTGDPSLAIPQNAVVKLFVKGVSVATFRVKSTRNEPTLFPPLREYYFIIDVSERMRDSIGPFSNLPSNFVMDCPTEPVKNLDSISDFYLEITYEILDLQTGLLVPQPTFLDVTNVFWATNITRQDLEEMYLDNFTDPSFTTRALTNNEKFAPNLFKEIDVNYSDNIFLSYLVAPEPLPINAYQITLWDKPNIPLSSAIGLIDINPNEGAIFTMNVGVLRGLICLDLFSQTAGFNLLSAYDYYSIQFGSYYLGSFNGAQRERFYYNVQNQKCCGEKREFRLHWLNLLGGVDSYTFCSIKETKYKSKAIIAEQSLGWDFASLTPHDPTDSSLFKTRTTDQITYRVKSENISNETALWLSEMLGSVKVYLEVEPNQLIPVIISDTEQLISKEKGKRNIELNITLSSCIITQTI